VEAVVVLVALPGENAGAGAAAAPDVEDADVKDSDADDPDIDDPDIEDPDAASGRRNVATSAALSRNSSATGDVDPTGVVNHAPAAAGQEGAPLDCT